MNRKRGNVSPNCTLLRKKQQLSIFRLYTFMNGFVMVPLNSIRVGWQLSDKKLNDFEQYCVRYCSIFSHMLALNNVKLICISRIKWPQLRNSWSTARGFVIEFLDFFNHHRRRGQKETKKNDQYLYVAFVDMCYVAITIYLFLFSISMTIRLLL